MYHGIIHVSNLNLFFFSQGKLGCKSLSNGEIFILNFPAEKNDSESEDEEFSVRRPKIPTSFQIPIAIGRQRSMVVGGL